MCRGASLFSNRMLRGLIVCVYASPRDIPLFVHTHLHIHLHTHLHTLNLVRYAFPGAPVRTKLHLHCQIDFSLVETQALNPIQECFLWRLWYEGNPLITVGTAQGNNAGNVRQQVVGRHSASLHAPSWTLEICGP